VREVDELPPIDVETPPVAIMADEPLLEANEVPPREELPPTEDPPLDDMRAIETDDG
jgi:hypothetical protein